MRSLTFFFFSILIAGQLLAQTPSEGYERTVRTLDGQEEQLDSGRPSAVRSRLSGRSPGQMTFGWEVFQAATLRFGASFGYTLGQRGALYVMGAAGGWVENWSGREIVQNGRTYNMRLSYRMYFSGQPMQGFFVAPFFRQKIVRYDAFENREFDPWGAPIARGNTDRRTFLASAGGFNMGWQMLKGHFHYDCYMGLGLQANTKDARAEESLYRPFDPINRGVIFQIGTSIGFGYPQQSKKATD